MIEEKLAWNELEAASGTLEEDHMVADHRVEDCIEDVPVAHTVAMDMVVATAEQLVGRNEEGEE